LKGAIKPYQSRAYLAENLIVGIGGEILIMIVVEKIRKEFGKNQVLKGISFNLKKGEFAVVLG
jgi:hypothetical protein